MSPSTLRTLIIAIVLLVLGGGAFAFMFIETTDQAIVLENQVETLAAQRAQESNYIRLQRLTEDTVSERARLSAYFLEREGDSIDFLSYVERLAPEAGVSLQTNDLESVTDSSGQRWIDVSFSISGSEQRIITFIEILENLPYVARMDSLDLTARSQTQWQAQVGMRVMVLAYEE